MSDLNRLADLLLPERHLAAYDAIGAAVDGMTIETALHILSVFTSTILDYMQEQERSKAVMVFSSVIMQSNPQPEGPVQ